MKKTFLYVLGFLAISGIGYGIYRYATGGGTLTTPKRLLLPYETPYETEAKRRKDGKAKTLVSKKDFDIKALNLRDDIVNNNPTWKKGIDDSVLKANFWEDLGKFRIAGKDPLTNQTTYTVNPDAYLQQAREYIAEFSPGALFYYDPADPNNYA